MQLKLRNNGVLMSCCCKSETFCSFFSLRRWGVIPDGSSRVFFLSYALRVSSSVSRNWCIMTASMYYLLVNVPVLQQTTYYPLYCRTLCKYKEEAYKKMWPTYCMQVSVETVPLCLSSGHPIEGRCTVAAAKCSRQQFMCVFFEMLRWHVIVMSCHFQGCV